jgi:hypothetical protein
VIGWHILLPAFTVWNRLLIAVLEGLGLATGRDVCTRISMFWIKIFIVAFAMGVVHRSGDALPVRHQLERYADATANVLSPLFAYEGTDGLFSSRHPSSAFSCSDRKLRAALGAFHLGAHGRLGHDCFSSFWDPRGETAGCKRRAGF